MSDDKATNLNVKWGTLFAVAGGLLTFGTYAYQTGSMLSEQHTSTELLKTTVADHSAQMVEFHKQLQASDLNFLSKTDHSTALRTVDERFKVVNERLLQIQEKSDRSLIELKERMVSLETKVAVLSVKIEAFTEATVKTNESLLKMLAQIQAKQEDVEKRLTTLEAKGK
jgi:hypothetical protein